LLGQASTSPAGHDPQYIRALKQLAGLDDFDRAILQCAGMPVALIYDPLPEHTEYIQQMSRAVSLAGGGVPVIETQLDMGDGTTRTFITPEIPGQSRLDRSQLEALEWDTVDGIEKYWYH
jgi:hypothetical protein